MPGSNKRRDERADGSVPLKLSGKSTNSLKVLPEVVVSSQKLLNEMIEQAYQDFVANEQQDTELRTAGPPVTDSAAYTTNVSGSYLWGPH